MSATVRAVASAAASTTSFTCSKPTGTLAGDLLIAFQAADGGTFAEMTTPTGGAAWAALGQQQWSSAEPGTKVWWKIAGGSEPATYGFGQGVNSESVVGIAALVSFDTTATPLLTSSASGSSTTNVPTPSVTPTTASLELRWAASWGMSGTAITWTPPATYTEQIDQSSGSFTSAALATKPVPAGATGIQNFTSSQTTTQYLGITVAVAGVSSPPKPFIVGQAVQRAAFY